MGDIRKATFEDGTTFVYDLNVASQPTHYNEHKLVTLEEVPDDTPQGFTAPAAPAPSAPAYTYPGS